MHNKLSIGFERLGRQLEERRPPGDRLSRPSRRRAAAPPAAARDDEGAPGGLRDGAEFGFARVWEWYTRLPRASAVLIAISVFLFAINVFSGLHQIWFQWPAAVLLLIAFLRAASRSRRS